ALRHPPVVRVDPVAVRGGHVASALGAEHVAHVHGEIAPLVDVGGAGARLLSVGLGRRAGGRVARGLRGVLVAARVPRVGSTGLVPVLALTGGLLGSLRRRFALRRALALAIEHALRALALARVAGLLPALLISLLSVRPTARRGSGAPSQARTHGGAVSCAAGRVPVIGEIEDLVDAGDDV